MNEKTVNLNEIENPLETIRQEQGEPEPEPQYLFTQEEGQIIHQLIKESKPIFKRFLGCEYTQETYTEMTYALMLLEKKVKHSLKRNDFKFVPIWNPIKHGFTIDAIRV